MSEFEDEELIQLSLLRDEETDELISAGLLASSLQLSSPLNGEVTFPFDEVILHVTAGLEYPIQPVTFDVDNINLPREVVDTLRRHLRSIVTLAEATNNIEKWRDRETNDPFGIFDHVRVVYQLAYETSQHIQAHRNREYQKIDHTKKSLEPDKSLWFIPDAKQPVPVATLTKESTKELAYRLLRRHPNEIIAMVPSLFRVLHVEQVLRADQARDLQLYQARLRQTLLRQPIDKIRPFVPRAFRSPRVADMVEHLVAPRITFHGTQRQYVPSIIRHGFVLPGTVNPETGERLDIRCGATYGQGIYSSPSAAFSLSYTDGFGIKTSSREFYGLKLFVCATVMGRPKAIFRDDGWRSKNHALDGADSHVGNDGLEYIVFDAAQIVPVYVVHLDWGSQNADFFRMTLEDDWYKTSSLTRNENEDPSYAKKLTRPQDEMFAGDRQRAKQAIHAKAAKYFPYGYGPATGNKFVVEEVGDVSEDEEEYGDYQALVTESKTAQSSETQFWSWIKVGAEDEEERLMDGIHDADQYRDHRHALRVPGGFSRPAKAWDALSAAGDEHVERDEDEEFGLSLLMVEDQEFRPHSAPS